jgi:acyl-CoA synthetase (AMP-forming)/AMP-acid ligase II
VARVVDPHRDLGSILLLAAERHGDRPGFEHGALRWTYLEFAARCARLASLLRDHGLVPGDVVAWLGDNTPHAAAAYFAAGTGGFVLAPLHARGRDEDLRRVLAHAGARAVLAESDHAARASALGLPVVGLDAPALEEPRPAPRASWVPREAGDPAHLYYTSGSTGTPKGVVLTHGNVCSHARLAARALGLDASDVWLHAAPMFHLADAWATFAVTLVGGVHRFAPRFDAGDVLDRLAGGTTVTNLVPTMWNALVRDGRAAGRAYPALRLLLSGGSAISPHLVRRVRETFEAEYAQTYGLTETSPYLTISRLSEAERALPAAEQDVLLARAGRPMPGVEVEVRAPGGDVVPADGATIGEVCARGPTVTPGYFRDPEATARAIRGGWLLTGDLARVFPDGRVELVDRTGDVIHSGGEKVFSADVERALADFPGVGELAVVGTADAHWGEVVTAVVVEGAGPVALEPLQAHARARLAAYQVPRRLVRLDALPRTASGKVSKRETRAAAERLLPRQ